MPWKNLTLQSKYRYFEIQDEYLQNNKFAAYFLKQENSFRPQQEHCNQGEVFESQIGVERPGQMTICYKMSTEPLISHANNFMFTPPQSIIGEDYKRNT